MSDVEREIIASERFLDAQLDLETYMALDSRRGPKYCQLVATADLAMKRLRAVRGNIYLKSLETV